MKLSACNLYFRFKGYLFLNQFRWKVSSVVILCQLHRLIWDNTLCTCIKPQIPTAPLISFYLQVAYLKNELGMLRKKYESNAGQEDQICRSCEWTLYPIRNKVKMAFATSIKPEQPASNLQSVQVLCCLLLISI
jgi:hypothetical protein